MPDPNDDPTALLTVTMDGTKEWRNKNRQLHRYDGPAVEYPNGVQIWYRNGKVHRDDGPAMEWADGTNAWYRNGDRHRDDGPAIEHGDGRTEWYRNGRLLTAQEIVAAQKRLAAPQLAEESQTQSAAKFRNSSVPKREHRCRAACTPGDSRSPILRRVIPRIRGRSHRATSMN